MKGRTGKQRLGMDDRSANRNADERDGNDEGDEKKPRLELSVPQVAGSAVAAIAAAVLASRMGVYGTILGAGVVSVVATSGGAVFQHFFRRTGEQIREVTVSAKPRTGQVPARPYGAGGADVEATRLLPRAGGPGDAEATRLLPRVEDPDDATRVLRQVTVPTGGEFDQGRFGVGPAGEADDEFGEATTHGTRVRGRKRSAVAAAVVFGVAMLGITGYELIADEDLSGGKGTTVGSVLRGGNEKSEPSTTPSSDPKGGERPSGEGGGDKGERDGKGDRPDKGTGTGGSGEPGKESPAPDRSGGPDKGDGGATAKPDPDPSASNGGGTNPKPTPTPTPTPTPQPTTGGDAAGGGNETGDGDGKGAGTANGAVTP
ncbi:hypothetical protein [Streptomyces sp. NPDC050504]|uniref:hypothetical protein n=1 Tax=Streptomyces sp. NPDC050504 TaxID=3365618 RepID=UPI00379490D3